MAVLTGIGRESHNVNERCDPTVVGGLDKCPFIWKDFERSGYATGFAEDEQSIQTFNYCKQGFLKQPTTHYFRPFALAAEKFLKVTKLDTRISCLGFQHYADYIYQYALDFATAYKNESFFGLFWSNTFSHESLSDPSTMDDRVKYYLEQLDQRGVLNESAVIFFSDHGMRYGSFRKDTVGGWYEERLPFMFVWLPTWFKEKHPAFVGSLEVNKNRLTSPYDIHMTLKHILELSGRVDESPPIDDSPRSQTLLLDVPWNRSCSEAGIKHHWCVCSEYKLVENKTEPAVQTVAKLIVDKVNEHVEDYFRRMNITNSLCAVLSLANIDIAMSAESDEYIDYMVTIKTLPSKAFYDATVRRSKRLDQENFKLDGGVSRLNAYGNQGNCVSDADLRKYCFCKTPKLE